MMARSPLERTRPTQSTSSSRYEPKCGSWRDLPERTRYRIELTSRFNQRTRWSCLLRWQGAACEIANGQDLQRWGVFEPYESESGAVNLEVEHERTCGLHLCRIETTTLR